jgi:hypothetical protein
MPLTNCPECLCEGATKRFMTFFRLLSMGQGRKRFYYGLFFATLTSSLLNFAGGESVAQAQAAPYCQLSADAIAQTNTLRQNAIQGNSDAKRDYQTLITQHAEQLRNCRGQSWLKNQAIWVRLYPCDIKEGALEELLDRVVSRGYNEVYVEVFYDGQALLPAAQNQTAWNSVIWTPGYENRDLLAEAIAKGHERGLKVYAWMFTLNFGYTYAQRPGAEQVLARNGDGKTTLTVDAPAGTDESISDEVFVDPYNAKAKQDYYTLVQSMLQRRPDGVLFDYVRYPKRTGAASVASRVEDLWIYGNAAEQALFQRTQNQKGRELVRRFLKQGYVSATDLSAINSLYPGEGTPLWQGRTSSNSNQPEQLQNELWLLSVAHAMQGVLDFLTMAITPVQQQGIPAGAVFFPDANQRIGQRGFDARLQPWDRFPKTIEWHPMAYGICGDASCIVSQVQRVAAAAPSGTQIAPALAGTWGQVLNNRPPLEVQMETIHQALPQISSISHFSLSWQDPQYERDRKFCRL